MAKLKKKIVNHIIFVLDESGSMEGLRSDVVQQFNQQISDLRADTKGQTNLVSLVQFSYRSNIRALFSEVPLEKVAMFESEYRPQGQTALYDGVLRAVQLGEATYLEPNANHAFLVVTITDGFENNSLTTQLEIRDKVARATAKGNWSFAFMVPEGHERSVADSFRVPLENVKGWELTRRGLEVGTQSTTMGLRNYATSRSMGATQTQSFYTPDVGAISAKTLGRLRNADTSFLRLPVTRKCQIREAVEHLSGGAYTTGTCLYELTKKETIQGGKQLALLDIQTNSIYVNGRDTVAKVLGLPDGKEFKVVPANHPTFRIFVQSKSVNRNLLPGTLLLVEKAAVAGA